MIRFTAAIGITLLASNTVLADHVRLGADQYLQQCQQPSAENKGFCRGYVAGIADSGGVCIPADINDATLANLVSSSLIEAGQQAAAPLILDRLNEVFPCTQEPHPAEQKSKPQNWSNKDRKPG